MKRLKKDWAKKLSKHTLVQLRDRVASHSESKPSAFYFLPEEVVKEHTATITSDLANPESLLFNEDGLVLGTFEAVNDLFLLERLAYSLGLTWEHKFGRGSLYRVIVKALNNHIEAMEPTAPTERQG